MIYKLVHSTVLFLTSVAGEEGNSALMSAIFSVKLNESSNIGSLSSCAIESFSVLGFRDVFCDCNNGL